MADQYDMMAHAMMRQFPGWIVFFGRQTRSWWAVPPAGHRLGRMIEARTVEDLADAIRTAPSPAPPVAETVPFPVVPPSGGWVW